jgi:hypothetical protein
MWMKGKKWTRKKQESSLSFEGDENVTILSKKPAMEPNEDAWV